jgi:hypothetical protein
VQVAAFMQLELRLTRTSFRRSATSRSPVPSAPGFSFLMMVSTTLATAIPSWGCGSPRLLLIPILPGHAALAMRLLLQL